MIGLFQGSLKALGFMQMKLKLHLILYSIHMYRICLLEEMCTVFFFMLSIIVLMGIYCVQLH